MFHLLFHTIYLSNLIRIIYASFLCCDFSPKMPIKPVLAIPVFLWLVMSVWGMIFEETETKLNLCNFTVQHGITFYTSWHESSFLIFFLMIWLVCYSILKLKKEPEWVRISVNKLICSQKGVSNFKYVTVHNTLKNSWNWEGVLNVYYMCFPIGVYFL